MKTACFWRSFQGPAYKGLATLFAQLFVVMQEGQSALVEATPADSARRTRPRPTVHAEGPGLAPPPCPAPVFSKSQQTHPSVCSSARPLPCGLALTEPLGAAWAACPGCPPTSAPGVPHARGQPRGEAGDYTLPGPHLDGDSQHRALVTTPPLVQSLPEDSLPGSRAESAQGPDTWGNRGPAP